MSVAVGAERAAGAAASKLPARQGPSRQAKDAGRVDAPILMGARCGGSLNFLKVCSAQRMACLRSRPGTRLDQNDPDHECRAQQDARQAQGRLNVNSCHAISHTVAISAGARNQGREVKHGGFPHCVHRVRGVPATIVATASSMSCGRLPLPAAGAVRCGSPAHGASHSRPLPPRSET